MKLNDFMTKLTEGITVHSEGLLAYAITVAEAYHEAPQLEPEQAWRWTALVYSNDRLLSKVASRVKVIPTPNDPYANEVEMLKDIVFNRRLYVYSGHSDNHPTFSAPQNVVFRTIHDWFAHAGKNAKSLENFYKQQKLVSPQDARGAEFEFKHSGFNLRGELNAYLAHAKLVSPDVLPALFTEIIGQVSSAVVLGDFPMQKVAVLEGFDYRNLGQCTGERAARMKELLAIITDPSQEVIPTRVNNISINKSTFNWAGISPGAGATKAKQAAAAQPAPAVAAESRIMEMAGAGPARIVQHVRQGDPFITISAMRSENDAATNKQLDAKLRAALKTLPVSYIPVEGEYVETQADGTKVPATEQSYFIMPNSAMGRVSLKKFRKFGATLCTKFQQESFGFGDGKSIYFGDQSGQLEKIGDAVTFSIENVNSLPGFSKIKDRKFSFTSRADHPNSVKYNQDRRTGRVQALPKRPNLP